MREGNLVEDTPEGLGAGEDIVGIAGKEGTGRCGIGLSWVKILTTGR